MKLIRANPIMPKVLAADGMVGADGPDGGDIGALDDDEEGSADIVGGSPLGGTACMSGAGSEALV